MSAMDKAKLEEYNRTDKTLLPSLINDAEMHRWVDQAACKDTPHLFIAPPKERPEPRDKRKTAAIVICASCPVQQQCRDHGRKYMEWGIWGGEDEYDRAKLGIKHPFGWGHIDVIWRQVKAVDRNHMTD